MIGFGHVAEEDEVVAERLADTLKDALAGEGLFG